MTLRRQTRRQNSTHRPRDRAVLLALARHRVLSFRQLRRLVFPELTAQRVGQHLHRLAEDGWLRIWEDASLLGGRPRYALPTRRALAVALDGLRAASADQPTARLASIMLPHSPRRPLRFTARMTPAFLRHQRECNDLLIAFAEMPGVRLRWATAWDRPFPLRAARIALPQPDYVLVLEHGGRSALVFGEHDRGHESLAHFRAAKAERYAAIAARPELARELFGFATFRVWVTVLDARSAAPLRRLARLVHVARAAAASDVMAFTLAGWAACMPAAPIWFCDGAAPETELLAPAQAPGLHALPTHPPLRP